MIDFTLDEEQQMLTDAIHRYAEERMRKQFRDADEENQIPEPLIQAGWEIGLIPSGIPEQHGGFGAHSAVTSAVAAEEFGWGDLSIALNLLCSGAVAIPVLLCGTSEQKAAYLPLFCEEQIPPLAAALTEPTILFDPRALATTAARDGDTYVLNGAKGLVPLAADAQTFLVYANEDGRTEAFLVPADAAGLTVGEREKLMGIRALPTYRLALSDCAIPASSKLGGDAGIDFDMILNHSRVTMAALAVGVTRAAHEYALEYAKQRVQFGEPIAHRQSIAFMLAEMAIDVDAARILVWEAAWKLDRGEDATQEATVMKHFVDEMAVRVADQALQVLGGYGYIREYPVELWLRNARGFATFDGLAIA
jgi:alkylation response protein AidB-like acyl-CoA dehydrogenase